MNYWLLFLPFIGALIGWGIHSLAIKMLFRPYEQKKIAGITFQGLIPKKRPVIIERLAKAADNSFSIEEIEQKISNPENLKKALPVIEVHIDEFLRVKLSKQMPVISMFIGDKTISSLKTVFMQEIEDMLPQVMTQFTGNLKEDFDLEKIVTQKLSAIPPAELEATILQQLSGEFRAIRLFGAVSGFLVGLISAVLAALTS